MIVMSNIGEMTEMDIDTQYIANPFDQSVIMALTQQTCQTNPKLGIAYSTGRQVGCWGTDTDGSVWLVVNGKNHHITTAQLEENAKMYKALNNSIPWQAGKSSTPTTIYLPPVNTYYYGAGGGYVGRSTSY